MTFFCNLLFTWVSVPSQMTWAQMSRLSICILYVVYRLSIYISCVSIYIFARPNGSMDMQHDLCANESLMQIFKSSIHIYKFRMDVCVFKMVCVRMYVSTVMYQDVRWMYIIDRRFGSRYKTCFQMCIYTYLHIHMSHVSCINESCLTYQWVTSHISMSVSTHSNVCIYTYLHIHIYAAVEKTCAQTVYGDRPLHIRMHILMYTCMYIYMYKHTYSQCMYVGRHIYIYTHRYI